MGLQKVVLNVDFFAVDNIKFVAGDYKTLTYYSMYHRPNCEPLSSAKMSFKASCQCQDSDCIKCSWFTKMATLELALKKENEDDLTIIIRAFRRVCNKCDIPCSIMFLPEDKERIVQLCAWRIIRLLYNEKGHILRFLIMQEDMVYDEIEEINNKN